MKLPLAPRSVFFVLAAVLVWASATGSLSAQSRKLNAPLVAEGDVFTFEISADGVHVLYLADQELNDRRDLYAARLDGSAPPVRLNPAWGSATRDVAEYVLTPDRTRVVYRADQESQDRHADRRLDAAVDLPAGMPIGDTTISISALDQRVVFLGHGWTSLYAVPADGSAAPTLLTPPGFPDPTLPLWLFHGDRRVAFVSQGRLYEAPLDGSTVARVVHPPMTAGGNVTGYRETPLDTPHAAVLAHGKVLVYRADQDTDGVFELYACSLPPRASGGQGPPVDLR